jgi:hypothetical protein
MLLYDAGVAGTNRREGGEKARATTERGKEK